jgi:sigma-B regulation protein RsbU (phosphoserine phosphatase)
MQNRRKTGTFVFYGLTAVMVVTTIFCFASALSWINRPFAGILLNEYPLVGSMGNREWPGYKAGLRFLDRIVSVEGETIGNGRDLVAYFKNNEIEPGTPLNYIIRVAGQTSKITIPVEIFSIIDFLMVFGIPFTGGLALYVLGVIVYILKPNKYSSWVFFMLCFCLGSYMVTGFETLTSYYSTHFHYLVLPLFAPTFVHLGLIFPDQKKFLSKAPRIEYLIYLPALILLSAYQIYLFNYEAAMTSGSNAWLPDYGQIGAFNRIFSLFCVASMLALILHSTYRALDSAARQRARIILFGVTMAFLPSAIIMVIVHMLKVNFPWNFLVFFVIFFPASIAYSIVRHNLFDADVIIRRTVGYVVVTAVVVGVYGVLSVSFNVLMGQYQVAQSEAFPILFTLGVILIFNPLRDRVQAIVDKLFFRKEYDYSAIVDKIGNAITSLMDLGEILKRLVHTFTADMFIDTSAVMLLGTDGSSFKVHLADGDHRDDLTAVTIERNDPLVQIMEKEHQQITKYDILEDPKYQDISAECAPKFEALQASVLMPLVFQDKLIGFLTLGEKKSGKFYNRGDIDLLNTLANQGAVAIENARLFQENLEKQRMEEELNIARDLQMSMLPAACPQVDGFQIAAFSIPAREVGGDFYDFTRTGRGEVALMIGDVTGKSVSGALVMSASRSIFRMLSEEDLDVAEVMIRANRRAKADIAKGMFVALLYAVLDPSTQRLSLCSAGQTQPVYISGQDGTATLLQTRGDTFPLGILDEADYETTQLQLSSGDKIIFYTDGIVEAMNEAREMFGFDRLLALVRENTDLSAEALLQKITDGVNAFTGHADQHDDLTIIILNALDHEA